MCRKYLQERGEKEIHTYGETPLTLLERIVKQFYISKEDLVVEMGSGRGRGALYLATHVGARVRAVDHHPIFCQKLKSMQVEGLEVVEGDFLKADLQGASVIYLYGTMLFDEEIQELIARFKKIP